MMEKRRVFIYVQSSGEGEGKGGLNAQRKHSKVKRMGEMPLKLENKHKI